MLNVFYSDVYVYSSMLSSVNLEKQVTIAMIKPDAVKAGLVDEIIQKVRAHSRKEQMG